jgi:hypothetical protein
MNRDHAFKSICFFLFGSPKGQVVSDQLHDSGGILVVFLIDLVNVSDGWVESLLGQLAGLGSVVSDFVEKHWIVQGQSESDWVGSCQLLFSQ